MSETSNILELDLRIEAGNWIDEASLEALTGKTLEAVLDNASFMGPIEILKGSELSLLFTDDANIQTINRDFRGQDKPTNVLSFPQHDADETRFGPCLGDIVIAFETVLREAELENKTFNHHLQHLMVHGFLHLFGYDHENDKDAEKMETLETAILIKLGIDDPYKD